jgi:hypothetical protein
MAQDDRRMHGGDTPGLVPGRGHEHGEEPVRLGEREPGAPAPDLTGDAAIPAPRVVPDTPTPDDEK